MPINEPPTTITKSLGEGGKTFSIKEKKKSTTYNQNGVSREISERIFSNIHYFLISKTVAKAETPSPLPTNPSFSVVVAFIEIFSVSVSKILAIFFCI